MLGERLVVDEDALETRAAAPPARCGRLCRPLDAHPQPIWIKDGRGRFVMANSAAVKLFCGKGGQLVGRTEAEVVHERDSADLPAVTDEILAGESERPKFDTPQPPPVAAAPDAGWTRISTAVQDVPTSVVTTERFRADNGRWSEYEVSRHRLPAGDGVDFVVCIANDRSEAARLQEHLEEHASVVEALFGDAPADLVFARIARHAAYQANALVCVWLRDGDGLRCVACAGVEPLLIARYAPGAERVELAETWSQRLSDERRPAGLLDAAPEAHHRRPLLDGALDTAPAADVYASLAQDLGLSTIQSAVVMDQAGRAVGLVDVVAAAERPDAGIVAHAATLIGLTLEHRRRASQLQYQTQHDPLTRLPNREMFRSRARHAIAHARRSGEVVAALVIDVDGFREVNETGSPNVGDAVLREVADRLAACVRETDLLARLSGDEFAMLLTGLKDPNGAATVARKVEASMQQPFEVAGFHFTLSASVGISLAPNDAIDAPTLLHHAVAALYRAQQVSPGGFQFFSAEIHARAVERVGLLHDLRNAIGTDELWLALQPQLDLYSGSSVGCEVLARWTHPVRGDVSPGRFIPLAEDTGLIVELGTWVLEESCRIARAWLDQHNASGDEFRFSVNVAAAQFAQPDFVDVVSNALKEANLPPNHLELEITESAVVDDLATTAARIEVLRELGVRVAIDDFGTGHAGFLYLLELPADRVKLDRAFVNEMVDDRGRRRRNAQVVKGMIELAHALDMDVVAEGVETEGQKRYLERLGCDHIQGWVYQRPFPANDVIDRD